MNIVLIGFMGAGKSTLGKELSKKTNSPFLDTDTLLESNFNCSISDYFKTHSEIEFRNEEKFLLSELKNKHNYIISTGGGMPIHNPEDVKSLGFIVYLQANFKTIQKRVLSNTSRPLVNSKTPKEIKELLESREPTYQNLADLIINTDNMAVEDCIDLILRHNKDNKK
jgi:shikimate kinase